MGMLKKKWACGGFCLRKIQGGKGWPAVNVASFSVMSFDTGNRPAVVINDG